MGDNKISVEGGDNQTENRAAKSLKRNQVLVTVFGIVAGVLALAVIGLVAGLAVQSSRHPESQQNKGNPEAIVGPSGATVTPANRPTPTTPIEKECKTKVCKDLATAFQLSIDKEVDPCDDFYGYSCGGWSKRTEIPNDQEEVQKTFGIIKKRIAQNTKAMLEETVQTTDLDAVKKRKNLYKSCMNVAAIESGGVEQYSGLLKSNNLSWPMMLDTEDKDIDIMAEAVRYANIGIRPIIAIWVFDTADGKRRIELKASPPKFQHIWGESRTAYINRIMTILKPNTDHMDAIKEMETYEHNLRALMATYKGMHDKDTHKFVKVKDLYSATNNLYDVGTAVKEFMAHKDIGVTLNDDDTVFIRNLQAFGELFMFVNGTKKTTIANELAFLGLEQVVEYLPDALRKIHDAYQKQLTGADPEPRFKTCVDITGSSVMPFATTRMYLDRYLPKSFKTKVNEIMDSILVQMMSLLSTTKWMDQKTRKAAVKKAAMMTYDDAYPDWILNDTELNREYQMADIKDSNSPLVNFLIATRTNHVNIMKLLKNDHPIILSFPLVPNSVYEGYRNAIAFTMGILLPPNFSEGVPKAVNYGSIGVVAGHEVTRGFDWTGRELDEKGNYFDWWTKESRTNYDKGMECVIQQYNNYTITAIDENMDGRKTLSGNIADIGGVKLAYAAYRNWVEQEGQEEPRLSDLDLSPDQLFFLSFATSRCQKVRVEYLELFIDYSVHTLGQFRVLGSLQGNEKFANAFGCPRGSRMNPRPQCPLW